MASEPEEGELLSDSPVKNHHIIINNQRVFQNYQPTLFFKRTPPSSPSPSPTSSSSPFPKHFLGVSPISAYQLIDKLGEGTFGEVYKAIYRGLSYARKQKIDHLSSRPSSSSSSSDDQDDLSTRHHPSSIHLVRPGDLVAVKRIIVHNELDGLPITSLREIRILKSLNHPNIVSIVDIAYSKGCPAMMKRGHTYMVFPYIDHDLAGLMENKSITFSVSQIKLYSKQLLYGTAYLHRNRILHRDLKAANLLISNTGTLLIADFGLARSIEHYHHHKRREYTNCVVTRWYRPPEILLGDRKYGTPVDMWGVGCVIAEMFKGGPILTGNSDVNQCELIFRLCGSPTHESMPGWESLPGCEGVRSWSHRPRRVKDDYERISPELADLLDRLLTLDPSKRLSAEAALDHDWFWSDPMPIDPAKLQHYEASHEYDRRKKDESTRKPSQTQLAAFTGVQQPQPAQASKPTPGQLASRNYVAALPTINMINHHPSTAHHPAPSSLSTTTHVANRPPPPSLSQQPPTVYHPPPPSLQHANNIPEPRSLPQPPPTHRNKNPHSYIRQHQNQPPSQMSAPPPNQAPPSQLQPLHGGPGNISQPGSSYRGGPSSSQVNPPVGSLMGPGYSMANTHQRNTKNVMGAGPPSNVGQQLYQQQHPPPPRDFQHQQQHQSRDFRGNRNPTRSQHHRPPPPNLSLPPRPMVTYDIGPLQQPLNTESMNGNKFQMAGRPVGNLNPQLNGMGGQASGVGLLQPGVNQHDGLNHQNGAMYPNSGPPPPQNYNRASELNYNRPPDTYNNRLPETYHRPPHSGYPQQHHRGGGGGSRNNRAPMRDSWVASSSNNSQQHHRPQRSYHDTYQPPPIQQQQHPNGAAAAPWAGGLGGRISDPVPSLPYGGAQDDGPPLPY